MLGYACINMTLGEKKISTNRSMIKKTFMERGIPYASELALLNVKDLETIKINNFWIRPISLNFFCEKFKIFSIKKDDY